MKTDKRTKHGLSRSRVYSIWRCMRARCDVSRKHVEARYAGRGIVVCDAWQKFENFFADMGFPPTANHSIDRVDNDKGYSKENCRWATYVEQARNTDANAYIKVGDERRCKSEWCEVKGISRSNLDARVRKGVTGEALFVKPRAQQRQGRPVASFREDSFIVDVFPNAKQAACDTGIGYASIHKCLAGYRPQGGGRVWTYAA